MVAAGEPDQGEIWILETPNAKRRPVLVVTRNQAIPVLTNVVVAPVTSTIRSIDSCVALGKAEGLSRDCEATFDNLTAIPKALLTHKLGTLGWSARRQICDALNAFADC